MTKHHQHLMFGLAVGICATAVTFYASKQIWSAPPDSPYLPGETLAPSCAPGSTNCTVVPPAASGANADITSLAALASLSVSGNDASMPVASFSFDGTVPEFLGAVLAVDAVTASGGGLAGVYTTITPAPAAEEVLPTFGFFSVLSDDEPGYADVRPFMVLAVGEDLPLATSAYRGWGEFVAYSGDIEVDAPAPVMIDGNPRRPWVKGVNVEIRDISEGGNYPESIEGAHFSVSGSHADTSVVGMTLASRGAYTGDVGLRVHGSVQDGNVPAWNRGVEFFGVETELYSFETLTMHGREGFEWMTDEGTLVSSLPQRILVTHGAQADQAYQYDTPSEGGTVAVNPGVRRLIVDPAGPLENLTVIFPANPVDGQLVTVTFTQDIDNTIFDTPGASFGSIAHDHPLFGATFLYVESVNTWFVTD